MTSGSTPPHVAFSPRSFKVGLTFPFVLFRNPGTYLVKLREIPGQLPPEARFKPSQFLSSAQLFHSPRTHRHRAAIHGWIAGDGRRCPICHRVLSIAPGASSSAMGTLLGLSLDLLAVDSASHSRDPDGIGVIFIGRRMACPIGNRREPITIFHSPAFFTPNSPYDLNSPSGILGPFPLP